MATRLNPYLMFNGNARPAMEFYEEALGGNLTISTFGEFGMPADAPGADGVMHAMLETPDGLILMASDAPPGAENQAPSGVSISLSGDDDAALRGYWEKLSAGATVGTPLAKQVWGDVFGDFVDKFGVSWLVNITQAG